LGVAAAGVMLSAVDQFLESLPISPNGVAFIVDSEGRLIGTSTPGLPYRIQPDGQPRQHSDGQTGGQPDRQTGGQGSPASQLQPIPASDSLQPAIRYPTEQIQSQLGPFAQITASQQLTLPDANPPASPINLPFGQRDHVRIVPYRDALGLDWRIVVVIPTADLIVQLDRKTQIIRWLGWGIALLAIATGVVISTCIARAMRQLSQTSQAIASGDLEQRLPQTMPIREIQVTATAFNQIATQLSQSFQQLETINASLGVQVQAQTRQLRQALHFEDLLRRIIEKVRDSLDEAQILQTAVRELAVGLGVSGCDVALYDLEARTSTICYEHLCVDLQPDQGHMTLFASFADLYQQLLQRQTVQFCLCEPLARASSPTTQFTCLACPIADDQAVLGDLWLFRPSWQGFSPPEIRLVQQIANHCAIALRQAQLYQQAQSQVEALERLHQLKDNFLNTVSHELRTPMANIRMATQLLEMSIDQIDQTELCSGLNIHRHLNILKEEGNREISLINDLLDLSRLDAGTEPYLATTIDPSSWIPHVAEAFSERAQTQQQQLQLEIAPNLPALTTDLNDLERILSELLNNACKYTPIGERITVAVTQVPAKATSGASASAASSSNQPQTHLQLKISNSGVEIPPSEQSRIFDKFYRIPSSDRRNQGGTGLGLALVKGLVKQLGGEITVTSTVNLTSFTLELPFSPPTH
jgi:signal transduction histidine kinase